MNELLGLAITNHARAQMDDRGISPDMVCMVLKDFDCYRETKCEAHHYVNLWRGPVRVTLAADLIAWVIVTVAWTDTFSAEWAQQIGGAA
jgi:hypothetical protein